MHFSVSQWKERYEKFQNSGFHVLLRDEGRSIEETMALVEKYLKLYVI